MQTQALSLKEIQLFSSLSDDDLHLIRDKIHIKLFEKQEIILFERDTNEFMYIVLSGTVKVTRITEEGKEVVLALHRTGDFFGEMSLMDSKSAPAFVTAMEDSVVAVISRKDFHSILFTSNKVLENLLQILSSRLRDSWEKITILSYNNASQRLRTLFTMLSDDYGHSTNEGITLNIKLTHQEIGNMVGMTRETVTRIIDKWQTKGEITTLKNRYIRLNPPFLQGA